MGDHLSRPRPRLRTGLETDDRPAAEEEREKKQQLMQFKRK